MQNYRILLNELPPEGREFHLDDQAIWQNSIEEFQMDCRITKPLSASISVLPTDGGWLVRGSLTGEVVLPCSRCTEDALAVVNARFEDFEELPEDDRELIYMAYWEDLKRNEMAAILGCSATAVRLRLMRAKRRLKTLVDGSETGSKKEGANG